jgi:hypothetical protein
LPATTNASGQVSRTRRSARLVDDGGQPETALVQPVEGVLRVGPGQDGRRPGRHHLTQLGEPVHALAVSLGNHPDGPAVLDDDDGAVRALGQQAERLAGGVTRA